MRASRPCFLCVSAAAVAVVTAYVLSVASGATEEQPKTRADVPVDRWAAYYPPAEFAAFQATLAGRITGVGILFRRGPDGSLRVGAVEPGSPAARAGLLGGDLVLSVAGRPVGYRPVSDVAAELGGPVGSRLSLVVRRGVDERRVELRRAAFDRSDVGVFLVSDGVVRIRVAAFTRGVGRQVGSALSSARRDHARGVVLDLRGDTGGLLGEAVETASAFLGGGPVVFFQPADEPVRRLDASGRGDTTMPLIVLVDGGTASAAEVVAAALQDRGRAVVVGSQTFGKGSVQEPTRLSDGSALELTVGRYLTPTGRSLEGVGVSPDIEVRHGADPRLAEQRAVEVLAGLLADAAAADAAPDDRG